MLILAFDTSSESQSLVLMEDGRLLAESFQDSVSTHSETLLPAIDTLLKDAGLTLRRIDGFGLTVGPGSFTGLRIGIATLKGLAAADSRPVAPISTLAALAEPHLEKAGEVIASLDARMNEVFTLRLTSSRDSEAGELCLAVTAWMDSLRSQPSPRWIVGSGALKHRDLLLTLPEVQISQDPRDHQVSPPSLGLLANRAFQSGKTCNWAELKARYWRASEAENRLARLSREKIP